MKLSILSMGSRGDFQPYAALSLALKARGHQVRLVGNENFAGLAGALGLDFVPLPIDSRKLTAQADLRRVIHRNDMVGFFRVIDRLASEHQGALKSSLIEACADSDLIVGSVVVEHIGASLAQHLGKAFVPSYLVPMAPSVRRPPFHLPFSQFDLGPLNSALHQFIQWGFWRMVQGSVLPLRQAWGLDGSNPLSLARRRTLNVLNAYSPSLCGVPSDWDPRQSPVCGAWALPSAAAQALPGDHQDAGFAHWLEDGAPPVFFSFGSMPAMDPQELLELVGQACEDLDLRGVLAPGWSGDLDALATCDLPEGLALAGECDQAWLFSHCAAVLHHGGAGTTHTASAAGVPQIVCPLFADQPYWAERVRRTGAGLALPFKRLTPDSLRQALSEALEPERVQGAAELGQKMAQEEGLKSAMDALERWGGGLATRPS